MDLVDINTSSEEQLMSLRGIGPSLAKRIVDFRLAHGNFHGPEDLAKVHGIGVDLANKLATQIAWGEAEAQEEFIEKTITINRTEGSKWIDVIQSISIALVLFMVGVENFVNVSLVFFQTWLGNDANNDLLNWNEISLGISGAILYLAVIVFSLSTFVHALFRYRYRELYWISYFFLLCILITATGLSGVSNLFYYVLFVPHGWLMFLKDSIALTETGYFILGLLTIGSLVLTTLKPEMVSNKFLNRIYEVAFILLGIVFGIAAWFARESELGLIGTLLLGFSGVSWIILGLVAFKDGTSIFYTIISFASLLFSAIFPHGEDVVNQWQQWINERLPDPAEQQALQNALNKTYPPSRLTSWINLLISGVGVWILVTVLEAIIEWFIQDWLEGLLSTIK